MPYDMAPNIVTQFFQGLMQGKQYRQQQDQLAYERERQKQQDAAEKAWRDAQAANLADDNDRQNRLATLQENQALATGWSPADVTSFIQAGGLPLTDPNFATKLAELSKDRTIPGAMATRQVTQLPQGFVGPELPQMNVAATTEQTQPMPWDFMSNQPQAFTPNMYSLPQPQVVNDFPVVTEQYQKPDTVIPGWQPQGKDAAKNEFAAFKAANTDYYKIVAAHGLGNMDTATANGSIGAINAMYGTNFPSIQNKIGAMPTAKIGGIEADTAYIAGPKTDLTNAQTEDTKVKTKLRPEQLALQKEQFNWKKTYQQGQQAISQARLAITRANASKSGSSELTANQLITRSSTLGNTYANIQKKLADLSIDPVTKLPWEPGAMPANIKSAISNLTQQAEETKSVQVAVNAALQNTSLMGGNPPPDVKLGPMASYAQRMIQQFPNASTSDYIKQMAQKYGKGKHNYASIITNVRKGL